MENSNLYKMFQITDILVNNYKYTQVILKQYQDLMSNEAWLFNANNDNYQVVRVTFSSSSQYLYEVVRIEEYLDFFRKNIKNENIKFLDIHINNDKYDKDNEDYDYINLDLDYSEGIDISNCFPELYSAIHRVEDPNKEITSIVTKMKMNIKEKFKKMPFTKRYPFLVTYIFMAICILMYIFTIILKTKYDDTSAIYIALGAEYKTYTLCFNQYFRLITYGFLHSNILHLIFNMVSLFSLGRYVEVKYGHLKYTIILLVSILCGGLCQGILSVNNVCLGISGGVYGLFVIYLIDIIKSRMVNLTSILSTILINISLNFLSSTAWMAHLGGAIAGYILYKIYEDNNDWKKISLLVIAILCLIFKYVKINSINYVYPGTDFNVLEIYYDLGLKKFSLNGVNKLYDFYIKYGGMK